MQFCLFVSFDAFLVVCFPASILSLVEIVTEITKRDTLAGKLFEGEMSERLNHQFVELSALS